MSTINPITYEVIRNRLIAMTEDMRVALQSASGSPTVTEASDFFTGIYLPDGSFASMGFQVTFQAPVVGTLIRHVQSRPYFKVQDGDMFIGNDPYVGALHQNDVQLTGPIFVDGELVAWAGVEAHETDVGGMDFASWSPKARDVYQEGMRIPCVKLVDGGEVREDVLDMILTASRLPAQLGLDIRAFIATVNVARERMTTLVRRYGAQTVVEVMKRMIAGSGNRLKARLTELPDGVYRASDFLEHDGHQNVLYKIDLELTKRSDRLRFDFSGSSPQAPGFINCTRAGLVGGVTGGLFPILAYDIPWNQGLLDCCDIEAPEGLVCTAQFPAPVGSATVEAIWVVSNVVSAALNKMLSASERYRPRAQAGNDGTMATFNLGGRNQFGEVFGLHLMDPLAGGSGAYASRDGVCAGGPINAPMPSIADVERNEQVAPLFYLHRRLAVDTGGPGKYRGGRSAEVALTLGGIDRADSLIMTHGAEVPNAAGLSGGWPGATIRQRFGYGAVAEGVSVPEGDWKELGPKPGLLPMTSQDVFSVVWQGGGGVGDPLLRDPAALRRDIEQGVVSPEAAQTIYGVVLDEQGRLDEPATQARRRALMDERAQGVPLRKVGADAVQVGRLDDCLALWRDADGVHVVSPGGHVLCSNSTRWRAGAVPRTFRQLPAQYKIDLHEGLAMTAWYCPASGALLGVDLHEKGVVPADDVELVLA
ncbi:MAG TPA: hydantoinase B/oxoprolinase family protein [Eoetvoesiella sp.]|uniref:hydantoinase B/oxoprolinase family protein n=1 Tax=Eoetvoesiella sp. TaxID=1966355 RepID=UPI002BD316BB|nr:hydantoinase B/oxoprolinase family protein [Eoetvoesiella sp.]HWK62479.1 hydantoinase B/oxoprolinase family protein [Eoetvoesiella sp.]